MSVQGIGNHAAHQLPQEMRGIQKQEPVSAPVLQNDTDKPSKQSGLPEYDEYIPGEKREPCLLYTSMEESGGCLWAGIFGTESDENHFSFSSKLF